MADLDNSSWKYLFQEKILERGEAYFYSGLITGITKTKNGWKAIARGTRRYNVEIVTNGTVIESMDCTCPYAQEHSTCKHMAGLLYALTEDMEAVIPEEPETLESVLEGMSADELRKELLRLAEKEPNTAARLRTTYRKTKPNQADAERVYQALDMLAYEYGDRDGFIDWESGSDYVDAFCAVLDDMVEPLIRRGAYDTAMQALDKAFYVLNNVEMDGSSGEHSDIAAEIEEYWDRVIHLLSPEERDKAHAWFVSMEKKADYMVCGDIISDILRHSFDDPKYIEAMLEEVRQKLNAPSLNEYEIRTLLEQLLDLLRRSDKDDAEFEEWLAAHEDRITVKKIRLEQAEKRKDVSAVTAILEDLAANETDRWTRVRYREKLLRIYQISNNTEKEKETLRCLLFDENQKNADYLRRLRTLTEPKLWDKVREFYLSAHPDIKPEIYAEEGLYDRLMESVSEREISVMNRYRELLADRYPKKVLERYLKHLEVLEKDYPNAVTYREMETYLMTAASVQGGIPAVLRLIQRWRNEYPTRKKMQEMLTRTEKQIRDM